MFGRFIEIECAHCGIKYSADRAAGGLECECPECGELNSVPVPSLDSARVALAKRRWVLMAGAAVLLLGGLWLFSGGESADSDDELAETRPPDIKLHDQFPQLPVVKNKDKQTQNQPDGIIQGRPDPEVINPPANPTGATGPGLGTRIPNLDQALATFRKQDIAGTLKHLERARAENPDLPPAEFMLAELFLAANQIGAARGQLERAANVAPKYPGTYVVFGNLALVEGRVTDADLHFSKASALLGEIIDKDQQKQVRIAALRGHATVAERRRDWVAVESATAELLKLDPDNFDVRTRLARAHTAQDRTDLAMAVLSEATTTQLRSQPAEFYIGMYLNELEKSKAAEDWFKNALQKAPENPALLRKVGNWYLEMGRAEAAQALAQKAHELSPTVESKVLCGRIARHLKRPDQALEWLEEAHRKSPTNFAASNALVLALVDTDDRTRWDRARQLAELNAQQNPNSAEARSTLGWVQYRVGDLERAEKSLQEARTIAGGRVTSDTAYYLAHVMADLGRFDDARNLLQGALGAPGRFTFREEAGEWLTRMSAKPK